MRLNESQKKQLNTVSNLDNFKAAIKLIHDEYLSQNSVVNYNRFGANHKSHQKIGRLWNEINLITSMEELTQKILELKIQCSNDHYGTKTLSKYMKMTVEAFIINAGIVVPSDVELRCQINKSGLSAIS
jgi:hypothetical protein